MELFLSDGRPLSQSMIVPEMDEEGLVADSRDNYFYEPVAGDAASIDWAPLACQPPGRWRIVSSREVRGTTFYPLSQPYGPSQTAITVTFTADRTVTKSAEVSGSVGVSIGFLESQVGAKLEGSVTTSRSVSRTFTVPKGKTYRLLAQIIYRQTECSRTAYAGPNCQAYGQTATVMTPVDYAVLVGDSVV
jgi:hypothetical protein